MQVTFTPHLVPVDRGLLSTCYARLVDMDVPHGDDLLQRYADRYADHPFVEVVERPPGMRAVQHTNFAQVCPMADPRGGRVTAFGVIDNLAESLAQPAQDDIAIVGLSVNFPGAKGQEQFWQLLASGLSTVAEVSRQAPGHRGTGAPGWNWPRDKKTN